MDKFYRGSAITKKQVGVIFCNAKKGNLKVEKWMMARMYRIADFYGIDYNGSQAEAENDIRMILDAIFANNLQRAQELINSITESNWSLLGKKGLAEAEANGGRAFVA